MSDLSYMARALRLADRGWGYTSPNPAVGCVIVREGEIIAEGYHHRAGQPHAEVEALRQINFSAPGSTLYVNLEPCSHYGRTPPCTEVVVRAGVKRVVAGMIDPNPLVAGRGVAFLREAGVEVEVGCLEARCRRLNETWSKFIVTGRPFVTLKGAMTLDGKIATSTGESQWITSEKSRHYSHWIRGQHDAILVGVGTTLVDNPRLTVRHPRWKGKTLLRVVLDSHLRLPLSGHLVETSQAPTLVFTTDAAPASRRKDLEDRGVEVVVLPSLSGRVDMAEALSELGRRGVVSVLVEGGAEVASSLALGGEVDRYLIFVAPRLVGGVAAPSLLGGQGVAHLAEGPLLEFRSLKRLGPDILVEALPAGGGVSCLPA